jgi:chaperonin GroEL (HSP60 family)
VLVATVRDTKTVLGAGNSEMIMARAVEEEAAKTPGKKALAMEAFARALRMIPTIIADNGGYDSAELGILLPFLFFFFFSTLFVLYHLIICPIHKKKKM